MNSEFQFQVNLICVLRLERAVITSSKVGLELINWSGIPWLGWLGEGGELGVEELMLMEGV